MSVRRFHSASTGLIHPSSISADGSPDLCINTSVTVKELPRIVAASCGELFSEAFIYSTEKPRDPSGRSLVKASISVIVLQIELYKASRLGPTVGHVSLGETDVTSRFLFFDFCGASTGDVSSVAELDSAVTEAFSHSCGLDPFLWSTFWLSH